MGSRFAAGCRKLEGMNTEGRGPDLRSVLASGYWVAILAVLSVSALRWGLNPLLGDKGYVILLFIPVLLATLQGGTKPGVFALVIGTTLSLFMYPSTLASRFDEPSEWLAFLMFLGTAGAVIALGQRAHTEQLARIRSEGELARLNAELEGLVEARTAELRAANDELEGFCYSMAHDMRTPTRAIAGNARILLEDYGDQLPATLAEHLRRVNRAALKQGALVDALLTYARLAKQPVQRETVDVTSVIHELARDIARREEVEVVVNVPAGLRVEADARQFRTALRAILENSTRYRKLEQLPSIVINVDAVGRLVVEDDGIGFDMAFVHKVRMPFERLHRDEVYPGVGMGLALVARIADRHGGNFEIDSTPGKGTIVSLGFGRPVTLSPVTENSEPVTHGPVK